MKSPFTNPPAGLPIYALNGAYTAKNILGIKTDEYTLGDY